MTDPRRRLEGKTAIVTGAGQGIGAGIARRFATEGARVVVVDRDGAKAASTAAELTARGATALAVTVDVSHVPELDAMVKRTLDEFGRIDILVNSAGVNQTRAWLDLSETDWDRLMSINLRGLFFCSQAVARHMIPRESGKILHIASISGKRGTVFGMHYSASKAGVISLTRTMALALAPHKINVNAICPGHVDTPMSRNSAIERRAMGLETGDSPEAIPLGRASTPDELAGLAAFLCSEEASYMTGQAINFSGGREMR